MAFLSMDCHTEEIARIASSKKIPSLPEVAARLLELARQSEPDFNEVAQVIRTDPAISGKILKTVNSALFGFRTKIETIERAVPTLGISMIRTLILSFHLAQQQQECQNLDSRLESVWRSCLTQAVLAELMSEHCGLDPSASFMAALLQDIGILAMMAESPREYADNVLSVARLPNTVAAERAHFGFSHVDVSSAIVKTWNVGDEFAQAIKHHHDRISEPTTSRPSLTQVLQAAHLGAMALHGGHAAPTLLDDHLKNWLMFIEQNLSITADSADDIVSDMHARVDNYAAMFNLKIGGGRSAVAVISEAKDLLNEIAIETQLKLVESQKTSKWRRVANELYSDWLSGAYNRRYVSECLEDAMAPWVTKRKPIAMLFLDVDKFKDINDTYGHRVGDQAIKHVAKWLSSTTRRKDIVIRLGGDEFLVVMQIALRPCKVVVNRIAQELPPLPMADEEPMPMSLSAGCVFLNPDPNEPPDINWLIDEADRLMYEVKNRGGRNVALREIAAQI